MSSLQLYNQISSLPDNLKKEVSDFIKSLMKRSKEDAILTHFASQSSLSKDWLTLEEDEAWKNL